MSAAEGIQMLVDIVAKGGNLLLNIAPGPEGEWQQGAYDLLRHFGDWMKINKEAIYGSKVLAPYKEDNICMVQQDNGNVYFFYMCGKDETIMPKEIVIESHYPEKGASVHLLGNNSALKWVKTKQGFKIIIPGHLRNTPPSDFVWTFKVTKLEK
jgi:alpha-L-fucosidase